MIERMKPHQSEPRLDDTRRDQEIRVCEAQGVLRPDTNVQHNHWVLRISYTMVKRIV